MKKWIWLFLMAPLALFALGCSGGATDGDGEGDVDSDPAPPVIKDDMSADGGEPADGSDADGGDADGGDTGDGAAPTDDGDGGSDGAGDGSDDDALLPLPKINPPGNDS